MDLLGIGVRACPEWSSTAVSTLASAWPALPLPAKTGKPVH
jgi:hypothetical protein